MKRLLLALALTLPVTSCGPPRVPPAPSFPMPPQPNSILEKAVNAIRAVRTGNRGLMDIVMEANKQKLLSTPTTRRILNGVCARLNAAMLRSLNITEDLAALDPASRGKLTVILVPILAEVKGAVNVGFIDISDPTVRQQVVASLTIVQGLLEALQGTLQ